MSIEIPPIPTGLSFVRIRVFAQKVQLQFRACSLLDDRSIEYYCQHCDRYRNEDAYRVTSDEFGFVRLDIIVCYECYLDARRLGLPANRLVALNAVAGSVPAMGVDDFDPMH